MTTLRPMVVLASLLLALAAYTLPAEAASRELLTAPRTYIVRGTDGDDADDCLSEATACRTWQGAVNKAARLDFGGRTVTILHGSEGPFTFGAVSVPALQGGGDLRFQGHPVPGETVFDTTAPWTFYVDRSEASVDFRDLTIRAASVGVSVVNGAVVSIENGVVFGNAGFAHLFVHDRPSVLYVLGKSYTIAGSAPFHIYVAAGSAYLEHCTVALVGTPSWAGGAFIASSGGWVQVTGNTFVGAATGQRFAVYLNGVINTGAGGPNLLPGSTPGSVSLGGLYY